MANSIQSHPYHLGLNNADWIHEAFAEAWDQQQRLQNLDGVQREHSLYGPQTTRLSWIYPPSHHFMIKPQSMLMPEVFLDDPNPPDNSMASMEAVDSDTSRDMGGFVVSPWRDVFDMRGRREVDLIVVKKLLNGPQIPLLVVELKRDDLGRVAAFRQIHDYLRRVLIRCKSLGYNHSVYGLLVLGKWSCRMIANWNGDQAKITYLDVNADDKPLVVETDSTCINGWLLAQALSWSNV